MFCRKNKEKNSDAQTSHLEEVSSYIDNEIYAIKMDNIIKIVTSIIALVVLVICLLFM